MINALNPDAVKVTPRGREMFDTAMWDKLDATPFARYSGAEMQVFKRPAQPIEGCPVRAFNSTTIHLDHYKYVIDSIDNLSCSEAQLNASTTTANFCIRFILIFSFITLDRIRTKKNKAIVKNQFFQGGVRITDPSRYIGKRLLDHI